MPFWVHKTPNTWRCLAVLSSFESVATVWGGKWLGDLLSGSGKSAKSAPALKSRV